MSGSEAPLNGVDSSDQNIQNESKDKVNTNIKSLIIDWIRCRLLSVMFHA